MKIKVVFDARLIENSGIGVYIQNIVKGFLMHTNISLKLIGRPKQLKKYFKIENEEIIAFDAKIYSFKEQIILPFFIPYCDVFFSPHFNSTIFPIRAKKRITTIHDLFHLNYYKDLSFIQRVYVTLILKSIIRVSSKIITVSNFSQNEIKSYFPLQKNKIEVIWNSINRAIFKFPSKTEIIQFKKKYTLPDNYLLFVGNVKPHKNLKILLQATRILLRGNISIKLIIIGKKDGFIINDSDLVNEIINDVEINESVIFMGFVPTQELRLFYSQAKCFIFPSIYEGFGLPPLEAMACNCPVIVSDKASLPEVCGDAAIYFNPYNAEELATKIEALLLNNNLSIDLVENGRKRIEKFSWEKSIVQHIKVIKSVI